MAYHINELKVTDFISDTTIKLPRFQRRQAWDEKKDFGLCVSMFKGYPLGVVIYNHTKEGIKDVNYLLDGRQRRSALKNLIENPTKLYKAAIKYLGIKVSSSLAELDASYWTKIGIYLNQSSEASDNVDSAGENVDSDIDAETQKGNLKLLLELLHVLHGSQKKDVTAFEKRWDFGKYFAYLPYIDSRTKTVDPKKLKAFIVTVLADRFCDANGFTESGLCEYLVTEFNLKEGQDAAFRNKLGELFDLMHNDFDVLTRVQTGVFDQASIGLIKIVRVSSLDSQNIFSLVNKGGTPLKAEELLSAKPYWNSIVKANELDVNVRNSIVELYRRLNIPGENDPHNGTFVYWDLCATFIDRVDKHHLMFQEYADDDNGLLLKVQHGFKTVAALLKDGVSAVRIEELEKDETINLPQDLSGLQSTINKMISILLGHHFFKVLLSWGRPLSSLIGITPTLEYLALLYKYWNKLDCASGDNEKKFIRGAFCLLDRLILEHAKSEWKGSSDSKMSNHLKGHWEERVNLVPKEEWSAYLEKACASTTDDYRKHCAILYYFTVLQDRIPDNLAELEYDIDHIIPQKEFEQLVGGTSVDVGLMNCLGNVSLLPRKKNEAKGGKKLNELSDALRTLVSKYSDVKVADFVKYSNVQNIGELVQERKAILCEVISRRERIMLA